MVQLNFDLLRKAEVLQDPAPHIAVENFLSPEDVKILRKNKPDIKKGGSFVPEHLELADCFKDLIEKLRSDEMKREMEKKFSLDFSSFAPTLTIRGKTREKDGAIHLDSLEKELTVLLYLNGGKEEWPGHAGKLRFLRSPKDLEDYTTEVAPTGGTLVAFPRSDKAWHGHHPFVGERVCVQLNYLRTHGHASYSYWRHYLSGFLKKCFG